MHGSSNNFSGLRRITLLGTVILAGIVSPSGTRGAELEIPTQGGVLLLETGPSVRVTLEDNGRRVLIRDAVDDQVVRLDVHAQSVQIEKGASRMALPMPKDDPLEIRRDGRLVVSIRFRSSDAGVQRAARPQEPRQDVPVTLYTVSSKGELVRLQVRGDKVEVATLVELGAPFPTRGVLTEGLAMSGDGVLYAVANIDVKEGTGYRKQLDQRGASVLYRIDPQSGESHRVGPIGHSQVDGLSFDADGQLYGVTSILGGGQDARLLKIDCKTGRAVVIASGLNLGDLDAFAISKGGRALIIDGEGVRDGFYEIELTGAARPKHVGPTPAIIPDGRDLEGAAFGADGNLYALTSADQHPQGLVYLVRIDPVTFDYKNLGLMQFGAYCLAADAR